MENLKTIEESTPNLNKEGFPTALSNFLMKEYNLKHDVTPKLVSKLPTIKEIQSGILIRVNSNGTAWAVHNRNSWTKGWDIYIYDATGKITHKFEKKWSDAKKHVDTKANKNAKYYLLPLGFISDYRKDKPASDVDSVKDREKVGRIDNIYNYTNEVFLPRLKPKLEAMIEEIHANLRKVPRNRDKYGRVSNTNMDMFGNRYTGSAREELLKAADMIEAIAENGFNRAIVEKFIYDYSDTNPAYRAWPDNDRELEKLLLSVPNAPAKIAQILYRSAKDLHQHTVKLRDKINSSEE